MPLIEYFDAGLINVRDPLQGWKVEMIRMFMGDPDVIHGRRGRRACGANQSPTIIEDFAYGPGVAKDCSVLACNQNTCVLHEANFDSLVPFTRLLHSAVRRNGVPGSLSC